MPTYPSIALLVAASLGGDSFWKGWTRGFWEWTVVALSILGAAGLFALLVIAPAILGYRFSRCLIFEFGKSKNRASAPGD